MGIKSRVIRIWSVVTTDPTDQMVLGLEFKNKLVLIAEEEGTCTGGQTKSVSKVLAL